MQKKSLLVALFCGALCLVGCIKNEESASVAQVRIAKANELNSIADLNKAKAQAELIYANAEATIAQAEAKLREANAALVLAQAETEKVRAELLKVKVQLAEVQVDEERIELQRLEAELEVYLAQYEAEIAQAEAAKQAWVNALNNLLAQAEIDAINSAKKLLEAEQNLEDYVLKLEGQKADSAKRYANLYFKAYDEVQKLQKEQITIKATKALVEAGAMEVRDAIYYQIDEIDEKIAEKQAIVDYLKKNQSMSPAEAQAALAEAREKLNDAFNAYQDALKAQKDAEDAQDELENKTADFTHGWNSRFAADVQSKVPGTHYEYPKVNFGEGENSVVRRVKTAGIRVPSKTEEGKTVFIPFWNEEKTYTSWERYPDVNVYAFGDLTLIGTTVIAPAAINYDNIKTALDTAIAHKELEAKQAVLAKTRTVNSEIEKNKKDIIAKNEEIALHQKYVDARKAKVIAAENAYIEEKGKEASYEQAKKDAWEIFQEYMLVNYDISRSLFTARNRADSAYVHAVADTLDAFSDLEQKLAAIPDYMDEVDTAFAHYNKAIAAYNVWHETTTGTHKSQTIIDLAADTLNARNAWNPDFDMDSENLSRVQPNVKDSQWSDGNGQVSGTAQTLYLNEKDTLKTADAELYWADLYLKRNPVGSANHVDAQGKYDNAKAEYDEADGHFTSAHDAAYGDGTHDGAMQKYEKAMRAWENETHESAVLEALNPDFVLTNVITYPTIAHPDTYTCDDTKYDSANKVWKDDAGRVAGSSQAELIKAVKKVVDAQNDTKKRQAPSSIDENSTTYQVYAYYMKKFKDAEGDLYEANYNLMKALGADFTNVKLTDLEKYVEEHIGEYIDTEAETKYRAYKDIKPTAKVNEAWDTLKMAYSYNPDEIGELVMENGSRTDPDDNAYWYVSYNSDIKAQRWAQYGWLKSSYKVDYKATMVNRDGKRVPIAENFYGEPKKPDYSHSIKYKVDSLEKANTVTLPKQITDEQTTQDNLVKIFKKEVADIVAAVNSYKSLETSYNSWVADRAVAEEKANKAKMDCFDAKIAKNEAQANYDAKEAIANEGMWVYDPDGEIFKANYGKYPSAATKAEKKNYDFNNKFTFLTLTKAIEKLEGETKDYYTCIEGLYAVVLTQIKNFTTTGDKKITPDEIQTIIDNIEKSTAAKGVDNITELNLVKKYLQETLKYGKIALQTIVDALDEEIDEYDEKIEVWTAIANKYKAIMNAYLGIVDEAVVEEPVAEEGDEE